MLKLSAIELAFDGAGSYSTVAGARRLQMTAHIGKPAASMRSRISAVRFGSNWLPNIVRISAALASNWSVMSLRRCRWSKKSLKSGQTVFDYRSLKLNAGLRSGGVELLSYLGSIQHVPHFDEKAGFHFVMCVLGELNLRAIRRESKEFFCGSSLVA